MMDNRVLVFDMDGTIADLYKVDGWLADLRAYNPRPYEVARPMYDMETMAELLMILQAQGWKVVVTTWLSKESTKAYDDEVKRAKLEWLAKHHFPFDEIHLVGYGTPKASCTEHLGGVQFLFDDNVEVRREWESNPNRFSVDATNNIMEKLFELLID